MSTAQAFSPSAAVNDLIGFPQVQRAFAFIDSHLDEITEEQIRICSIPATPFGERERAEYLREKFSGLGLEAVHIDEEGNCLGLRKGQTSAPLLVVSAHLDTVFYEGTDFTVRRVGGNCWRRAFQMMVAAWSHC